MPGFHRTIFASSLFLVSILASQAFSQGSVPVGSVRPQSSGDIAVQARQMLDKGICDFKNKKYALAQTDFEKALELDPANKLLPVFLARAIYFQYRPDVPTAPNDAKGREAIAAYGRVLDVDPGDGEAASAIAELYQQIDRPRLQDLAADEKIPTEVRKRIYTNLAAKSNTCANDITSQNQTKVSRNGQTTYVYHLPANKPDLVKGQNCARDGIRFIEKAIGLAPEDEATWSYKASLLIQMARFAEMEQSSSEKAAYTKQADEAKAVFRKIADSTREKQRIADDEAARQATGGRASVEEEQTALANFIATGRLRKEPPVDSDSVDSPLSRLVAPPGPGTDAAGKQAPSRSANAPWKTFKSADGDFTVSMPSPVQSEGYSNNAYSAASDGVSYSIILVNLPPDPPVGTDVILATVAFEASGTVCRFSLMADSTCEISFARKLTVENIAALQYSIAESKCGKVFPGLLRVYAARKKVYSLIVTGADENDPRVSKFLTSFSPAK